MDLKVARCPHCGAHIKVNPELEVATCRYCQMKYDVKPAIHAFEMESNPDEVTGNGQRVVSSDIKEDNRPITKVILGKYDSYQIYLDLRYELLDQIATDDGNIEYCFIRDERFNDPRLKTIEDKILSVIKQEPDNKVLLEQEKKRWIEIASFMGLLA